MIKYYRDNFKILEKAIASIDETRYEELLSNCYKAIENGGKVIASGLGKNVPICEKFVGTMNSYGLPASFLHTNTAVHGDLGIVGDNDVVILLSKSGNTAETLVLCHHLQKRNCDTWAFSCNDNAKAFKLTHENLYIKLEHEGDQWDIVPNNSTTVFLIVLQGVAIELANRFHIDRESFALNHPGGSIGERLGSST
jgi:sugar isomerase (SIS)